MEAQLRSNNRTSLRTMYPKLKYLYFIPIIAACLVASCSSDAPESKQEEPLEKGAELSFTTTDDLTRAITTSLSEFSVYGDMKHVEINGSTPLVVFNKTGVKYQNGSWSYEGTQYWFHNHEHSFVAVAPSDILGAGSPQYSNSGLTFTYSIPNTGGVIADRNAITDILVASHRRLYKEQKADGKLLPEPGVKLKFGHIMSLVNVALALDDDLMKKDEYVLVSQMELSGIRSKAKFYIQPEDIASANQTDNYKIEVTGHEGDARLIINFDTPLKLTNKEKATGIFAAGDAMVMLPQAFAADSKTKIVFTYTINGDTEAPKRVSLSLKDTKWETGKSYNYQGTFAIDKTEINMKTMGITDWTTENREGEAVSD